MPLVLVPYDLSDLLLFALKCFYCSNSFSDTPSLRIAIKLAWDTALHMEIPNNNLSGLQVPLTNKTNIPCCSV